jgi:hypothetical protein
MKGNQAYYLDHSMEECQDVNQGPESWMATTLQGLPFQRQVGSSQIQP